MIGVLFTGGGEGFDLAAGRPVRWYFGALFRVWTYVGVGPWGSEQVLPDQVRLPILT